MQEMEGGPCCAPGTLEATAHACGMTEASSCLAQAHPMSPRPSHPHTLPGKSLRPALPGDSGKQLSPGVGLDKGFLQEPGLRTLSSPTPRRAGAVGRPQAGWKKRPGVPWGPSGLRIQGNRGSEAAPSQGLPHLGALHGQQATSEDPPPTPPRATHLGQGQVGSRPEAHRGV